MVASGQIRSWILILLVLSHLAGCGDSLDHSRRMRAESARTEAGLVARSVLKLPAGDCMILHFPPVQEWTTSTLEVPDGSDLDLQQMLRLLLNGDERSGDEGRIVQLSERWGGAEAELGVLTTFNCATYAVGDLVGLAAGDWLNTRQAALSGPENPLQIVLDSAFDQVAVFDADRVDWDQLQTSADLATADVVCLTRLRNGHLETAHVGRVVVQSGRNWLESKIGRGPVVRATLQATAQAYAGTFEQLRIYRRR